MNPYNEIQKTFEIKNGVKIYDFAKCVETLENLGKHQFGKKFKIHEKDVPVIKKLLIYAIRDESTARAMNIDVNKGIILSGPVGCGKTSMMWLINFFSPQSHNYKIIPCRDIAFEFATKGYEALSPFTKKEEKQSKMNNICFDDLGTEKQIKYFGNECNVMAEIILTRYDSFITNKTMTHVTTNLSASELETCYGDRVRSRMRQMFNLIPFDKNSPDKR
ncbi:P-loop NTPase family protein [Flavobacterium lacus]|uniref:DNA replication protein DnaC n=1 Tax=Flavobacterium lacus TaxID=1353778 RepID=A0A328WUD9_9FLAO|nr:ATPase [Flavobacterium lacus]RAR46459.1 DNA replication protein DnaC [Flavobacterium lacus]